MPFFQFSQFLLAWWDDHGRKDLPWQQNPTPYRVWVSEIMLQQTQVGTVIPYYQRLMDRFPDLTALASSSIDEVLHHWSGLGYYARARNLHRAAQIICDVHDGIFPLNIDDVMNLPGIGRSTAGAILALADNQVHPILDGNVKRVLSRFHAIEGWPGNRLIEEQLWQLAHDHTPMKRVAHYTQAIMDLGATLCVRGQPDCGHCPLRSGCEAYRQDRAKEFPASKPRATLPVRHTQMLLLLNREAAVLMVKRPPTGIWGGLWSLPECALDEDIAQWCRHHLGLAVSEQDRWPVLRHTFSHFQLDIHPVVLRMEGKSCAAMEDGGTVWYNPATPHALGLATPVQRLVNRLASAAAAAPVA